MFGFLKKRRRRQLLDTPFPVPWRPFLDDVVFYRYLSESAQSRLRDALRIFIAEKTWEGSRDLVVTEQMQVTIAAQACLLVLGMDDFYFDNVPTVLILPEDFVRKEKHGLGGDLYLEADIERIGEADHRGQVVLSWSDVLYEARHPGQRANLVIHEFSHQLDMLNGEFDGVPLLPPALAQRWQEIMAREFQRLVRQAERGHESTLLDPYGATNPAEFFAVVCECFFDLPAHLEAEQPQLYALLRDYFRQDPASWYVNPA